MEGEGILGKKDYSENLGLGEDVQAIVAKIT